MQPGHVFIIEDDDSLRESLVDLISFAGYSVQDWSEPESFLAEFQETTPAVVITDMRTPSFSGVKMHAKLQTLGCRIPVIYISGESSVQECIEAMKMGALEFLVKPFSREALLKAVATGIDRHFQEQQKAVAKTRLVEAIKSLTPREREVHQLMLKGYSNHEIVTTLGISLPTAKQYKSEVLRKLDARSLSQLIKLSEESAG